MNRDRDLGPHISEASVRTAGGSHARIAAIRGVTNGPVPIDRIHDLRRTLENTPPYTPAGRAKRARQNGAR